MRIILFLAIFIPCSALAQISSVQSGAWNDPDTWDCDCVPDIGQGIITIEANHNVTISNTFNVEQIIINPDGILTINDGGRLILLSNLTQEFADPPNSNNDGQVIISSGGILENRGVISSLAGSMIFQDGSEYQHNQTSGSIAPATWQTGSTCRITGWTSGNNIGSSFGLSLNQAFHHFIWDNPGQTAGNVQFQGSLTTVNGNLIINSTGNGNRMISLGGTNTILNVGGDFIVNSQGRVSVAVLSVPGTPSFTMNVFGNCNFSSTNGVSNYQIGGSSAAGTTNFNIAGDLILNSGEINLALGLGAGYVNVGGNLELNGGSIIKPGEGTGNVSFTGAVTHDLEIGAGTFAAGNLIVQAGTFSITGNPLEMVGNITIQNGATFNMPAALSTTGDLQFVSGSIINSNNGTITLSGSTLAQTINANGATLHNITIDKSIADAEVTLSSPLLVTGQLNIISSGEGTILDSGVGGNLTLRSTSDGATGNAQIGPLLNTSSVSGNVNVQRYMSPEGRIYRYISSPVTNAPVSQLQLSFPITGTFTGNNNGGCSGCSSNSSMFFYNTELGLGEYEQFPVADNDEILDPGRGYAAFIRQNVLPAPTDPVVYSLTGPINQGPVPLPVFFNAGAAESWNLVGNPYPSSIDWDDASWTKTNIAESIAVRDNGAGMFRYWDGEDGEIEEGVIATGQGFWVRTTLASPGLIVSEPAKSITTGEFYRTAGRHVIAMTITKGSLYDKTYFKFREGALPGLDAFDAPKLTNDNFDFYTRFTDTMPLAINAVNELPCGTELFLDLRFTKTGTGAFVINPEGNYNIGFEIEGSEFEKYTILLQDQFSGLEETVTSDFNYSFTITEDPASFAPSRLKLVFQEKAPDLTLALSGQDFICGSEAVSISVKNTDTLFEYFVTTEEGKILTPETTGTGGDLMFTFPASLLAGGSNQLRVGVKGVCSVKFLQDSQLLTRYEDAAITIQEGDILVSNHTDGNQWYFNEELIPGAISQSIKAHNSGKYTLKVNTGVCSSQAEVDYAITGLESETIVTSYYPNPFMDRITLVAKDLFSPSTRISISNSVGQEVRNQSDLTREGEDTGYFSTGNLSDGFYFIKIKTPNAVRVIKVIKNSK